ncbi:MAG: hypothetical protein OEZ68_04520 [Gammaproteobacteria bacterium]|nr:hypothetical protein [Gammaproteobacteria bacterium]MDH5800053.1 hypothetical protein [Gammaproteobacteria bacterium]
MNIKDTITRLCCIPLGGLVLICAFFADVVVAEDLNCMLCHKYFGLSAVEKNGSIHVYYINEDLISRSPHASVECTDCHEGIDEVPHKDVKQVDCTVECHIEEPAAKRRFSHKGVQKLLRASAHSSVDETGKEKKYKEDYPGCRQCHEQPLYRSLLGVTKDPEAFAEKSLSRCKNCHEKIEFVEKYFRHVASRMQRQTGPMGRIDMCSQCHSDVGIMERHKLDNVVASFKETFHYKMLRLGSEKTPDCIGCHVVSGANGHLVKSQKDQESSTHPARVGDTCKQAGCHEKASVRLAGFKTHVTYEADKYPLQFILLIFFRIVMTVVLYGFLIVVALELFRRLFPLYQLPDSVIEMVNDAIRRVYVSATKRNANK